MEDFKKYISTNFILLSADTTVEEAYSKIDLVKPEFVLVYKLDKLDEEKLLYYTFLAKLLSEFRKDKPGMVEPTYKLDQFLDLLENKENKTSEISDVIPSANDPAVDDLIQNNKDSSDLIPLFHGDFIVGVFDPNRQNANFLYILKGYNFSVQRKSLFPEPEDKSSKTKLIGKGIIPKVRSFRSFLSSEYTDSIGERIVDTSSEETTPRKPNAETPTKIGKFASVKMRKNMKIGTKESLLVQLQSKKPPEEELPEGQFVVDVSYPAGVSNVELLVLATSSNSEIAEIQDQKPKDMIVPKDGDSNIVEFTIIPKKEGVFTITTFIFFKSNPLTILQSHAKVGNITNDSICGSSGVVNPDTNNPGADLLIIFEKTGGRSYGITVIAPELGIRHQKFECVKITESLKRYCRSTLAKIEKISPYEYTPDDIKKSLSGIGTDLYNRIFPNSFKEFYWKHKEKITSIQVISDEPCIPWEIIKPTREIDGVSESAGYFCEEHKMTRWLTGVDIVNKPTIKSIKIVRPNDTNLKKSKDEEDFLKKFWDNEMKSPGNFSKDSTLEQVTASLEKSDFDILHFTTHGAHNQQLASLSEIVLEKGKVLTPTDITRPEVRLQKSNPLVILNACQTGNLGYVLTGIGGWSQSFLSKKASGFIGTLWSVSDESALNFTESLYENLKNKKSLDESVRKARLDVKNKAQSTGDPSWLAYSLYAQPNAKFELEGVSN